MTAPANLWPYDIVGNRGNSPIVFLHGFMGRGLDWMPITYRLEHSAYSILPDLPGHGKNIYRNIDKPLTLDILARELDVLLDHVEITMIDLVGYSMGGRLALYFALRYPNRVRTLVLESTSAGIGPKKDRKERQAVDSARAEQILEYGMQQYVEHWYKMPLFHTLAKEHELYKNLIQARGKNDPAWMAKAIRDLSPGYQPQVWDQLQFLKMPVLLIAGEMDEKYIGIMHQLGKAIEDSKEIIISRSGHNCHLERPERFSQYLVEFLWK